MLDIKSKEYEKMIKEMKEEKEVVETPWGMAKINTHGRYQITSSKEGFNKKYVHRLIWETFYKIKIPNGYIIHHPDGNKLNNAINNLQCVKHSKHSSFHNKGDNNYWSGKKNNELSKKMRGKNHHFYNKKRPKHSERMKGNNNPSSKYNNWWDISCVHYRKQDMFNGNRTPNPCKCFRLKYKGKDIKIGSFHDFVSVEIISKIINDENKKGGD